MASTFLGGGGGDASVVGAGGGGGGGGDASAANQTLQLTELRSIAGLQIPPHDNVVLTYRTSGNGIGKIDQVVYKTGATTVATLTLLYDASNRLSTVTKS